MPREKIFKSISVNDMVMDLLTGSDSTKYVDMYAVAETYYKSIISFLDQLDSNKTVVYEHTGMDSLVRWQKKGKDDFSMEIIQDGKNKEKFTSLTAQLVMNMIFKHAPFIEVVGTESSMNLE